MSLALHGKYELELAAQKALELLHYVSDITNVDGKILAIMGLITGLSGQAKYLISYLNRLRYTQLI